MDVAVVDAGQRFESRRCSHGADPAAVNTSINGSNQLAASTALRERLNFERRSKRATQPLNGATILTHAAMGGADNATPHLAPCVETSVVRRARHGCHGCSGRHRRGVARSRHRRRRGRRFLASRPVRHSRGGPADARMESWNHRLLYVRLRWRQRRGSASSDDRQAPAECPRQSQRESSRQR